MSLTGRFSTLFLATLALILGGFSIALDLAARIYLERRVAERISGALDVLTAAAEIHPDGVEWEPGERFLPLGREEGADQLRWMIFDPGGRRVDRSINLREAEVAADWAPRPGEEDRQFRLRDRRGGDWRAGQRRVRPGRPSTIGSKAAADRAGPPVMDPPTLFFPSLDLMVCASLEPMASTLGSLRWFLVGLGSGTWVVAALACRRLSRHALAPLLRLVESARQVDPSDPTWTLEEAGTGDELDQLGRSFNDLLARLHRAYDQQRRFSGDASHQMRTPLTILIGQIEVTLRRERSAEEYRRVLDASLARAVQIGRILEALLFLAHHEANPGPEGGEALDLDAWASDHADRLEESGTLGGVVRYRPAGRPLPVRANPMLLGQLIGNLLENAVKYAGAGRPIEVEAFREGRFAVIAVQDSGPGIAPADAPRVFDPLYRSESARSRGIPGAGLGLAVVRRIAASFGGTVVARNPEGRGCRIELRLPLEDPARATGEGRDPEATPSGRPEAGRGEPGGVGGGPSPAPARRRSP